MKIRSIVRAGMLCAVYGVFIVLNTVSGLWIESVFPYLFAVPILFAALDGADSPKVTLCAYLAMLILTLLLSSFTTWLIAGGMLKSGYLTGRGLARRQNVLLVFLVVFVLQFVVSFLSMSVLASLFGFDLAAETEMFPGVFSVITPLTFVIALALFESLLESLACILLGVVMMLKILPGSFHLSLPVNLHAPRWSAWIFLPLYLVWLYLVRSGSENLSALRDVVLCLWLADLELLVWEGYLDSFLKMNRKKARSEQEKKKEHIWIFILTFCALLPGLNLIVAAIGFIALVRPSSAKGNKD